MALVHHAFVASGLEYERTRHRRQAGRVESVPQALAQRLGHEQIPVGVNASKRSSAFAQPDAPVLLLDKVPVAEQYIGHAIEDASYGTGA